MYFPYAIKLNSCLDICPNLHRHPNNCLIKVNNRNTQVGNMP